MPGHMEFEFNIRGEAAGKQRQEQPFNLLILGNFRGQAAELAGEAGEAIAKRRTVNVDLDNVGELWSLFSPYLQLHLSQVSIELSPGDIDDFLPDQLYRMLPVFRISQDGFFPFTDQAGELLTHLITQSLGEYSIWWYGQAGQTRSQMVVCIGLPSHEIYLHLLTLEDPPAPEEKELNYVDKIIAGDI